MKKNSKSNSKQVNKQDKTKYNELSFRNDDLGPTMNYLLDLIWGK
ncbi:hypothetical protein [Natroniella sulfidigena]|nr:hypothetical protein [Natroniella sulfidigena]